MKKIPEYLNVISENRQPFFQEECLIAPGRMIVDFQIVQWKLFRNLMKKIPE